MTRWSEEQKAEALEVYKILGPREAARQLGCDTSSVTRWAHAAGVHTMHTEKTRAATEQRKAQGEQSRADLRVKMLAMAHDMLARMDAPHDEFVGQSGKRVTRDRPDAGSVRNYATSLAILVDKLRLEEGAATSRHEEVNADERRRRIAERLDELETRRQNRRAG